MHPVAWKLLIALEAFQVAFLLLHDWLPVPPLNDVAAQREAESFGKRLGSTLLSAAPFVLLLVQTVRFGAGRPPMLLFWLWFGYGLLFLGELKAWWVPYGLRLDPELAARYAKMFGSTHAFLPERHGIRPNTLHVVLHATTVLTLCVLALLTFTG